MLSVLMVFTSADKTLKGTATGYYLPEAAYPYYVLAPHANVDFASPKGPNSPLEPSNFEAWSKEEECARFLADPVVKSKFEHAKRLAEVNAKDYDLIFYVGGHGPAIDLPEDSANIKLASQFWQDGKIVAAVCHGTAALVGVTDKENNSIFKGRRATGFSNAEEESVGRVEDVPFLLETKIGSLGGKFEKSGDLWEANVVIDGKLMTGQNPASSGPLAQAVLQAVKG